MSHQKNPLLNLWKNRCQPIEKKWKEEENDSHSAGIQQGIMKAERRYIGWVVNGKALLM
jgi:hypothetical protein